jgi:hypothetical protein
MVLSPKAVSDDNIETFGSLGDTVILLVWIFQ